MKLSTRMLLDSAKNRKLLPDSIRKSSAKVLRSQRSKPGGKERVREGILRHTNYRKGS